MLCFGSAKVITAFLLRCSASTCLTLLSPCSWARTRRNETRPLPTVRSFNMHIAVNNACDAELIFAFWRLAPDFLGTDSCFFTFVMPGMTMEVLGTLVGAAIQGQIVASAHTLKHCRTQNTTTGYLGNSSGAEIVKSPMHSQDYLSHGVSVTVPRQEPRCGQSRPQIWTVVSVQGREWCSVERGIVGNRVCDSRLSPGPDIQNGFMFEPEGLKGDNHFLISEPNILSRLPSRDHRRGSSLTSGSNWAPTALRGLSSLQVIRPIYITDRTFEGTPD